MILKKDSLEIELCTPGTYYLGTRFDWSGVFRRIDCFGRSFADEWFNEYDPRRHDAVCGPSEEFLTAGFDACLPGGEFVKIGVGVLRRPDDAPYDRFRLYEIIDSGNWSVEEGGGSVVFRQVLDHKPFSYEYTKKVSIISGNAFTIRHSLTWKGEGTLCGHVYNHHFFTFGMKEDGPFVGPENFLDLPYSPCGHWRPETHCKVGLTHAGVRFMDTLKPGEKVFMGDLGAGHTACVDGRACACAAPFEAPNRYDFTLGRADLAAHVTADPNYCFGVYWANHRVACFEPYLPLCLESGQIREWSQNYVLDLNQP